MPDERSQALPNSQGLEEYTLVEKMGDGAFSNVYKAVDRTTGKKVAVKVVRKYELNSSQVRHNFPHRDKVYGEGVRGFPFLTPLVHTSLL